jgi:excisionase family DNA binding protein
MTPADVIERERLETPKQLAARVGLSERQVRRLIQTRQLEHVMIGCRVHIPVGAFTRFLEARSVLPCQDETKGRDCDGSTSGAVTTSSGLSEAAVASAALARQTANRLKSSSPSSSNNATAEPARVIPMRSS